MKYTIEQIREAIIEIDDENYADKIITQLTRPEHTFREGEVVFHSYLEDDQPTGEYIAVDEPDIYGESYRPLTLSEMPAAVSELRSVINKRASDPGTSEGASRLLWDALAAFDEKVKA